MENFDKVQKSYDELVSLGIIHDIPFSLNQETEVNEQKAYLTRRAAYYLNQVDPDYGLLAKTTGTNVQGLSTDIILRKKSGIYYDIATDVSLPNNYRAIRITNSGAAVDISLIPNWIQPTKELAGITNGGSNNGGSTEPINDVSVKLSKILDGQTTLGNLMESYHSQVMSLLQDILDKSVTFPEYTGKLGLNMTFTPKK